MLLGKDSLKVKSNMEKHFIYTLSKRYPQLVLPIQKDARLTQEYKDVCLNLKETNRQPEFSFDSRDKYDSVNTEVGTVEVITMYQRKDFVHMAQALGNRCELVDIPDSTGAMAIFGLNNIEKFKNDEENFKDSIILLSSGYYSNVSEIDIKKCNLDLSKEEWIEKSIIIRKYHELTHFVMRKKYPDDIKPIRDELIADIIGIICAFKEVRIDLLKLFLGLENDEYRSGGRLENYEGGNKENIPNVLKQIDELEDKFNKLNTKDVNEIWKRIIEVM